MLKGSKRGHVTYF